MRRNITDRNGTCAYWADKIKCRQTDGELGPGSSDIELDEQGEHTVVGQCFDVGFIQSPVLGTIVKCES
jgi:hypothetical protein